MAVDWGRAMAVYHAATAHEPSDRPGWLDEECAGNAELRASVEELLRLDHSPTGDLFGRPVDAKPADAHVADPAHDRNIGRQIGHYRIRNVIASGGMGTVYLAEQRSPHRPVALKLLKHEVSAGSALRRFELEAELLGRLRHRNIAQIYEAGTHDDGEGGVPYFAMEYIPAAVTIVDYACRERLNIPERLELFEKVCQAVGHGHQRGIIHRDLKPSNVLVDTSGEPKVIDFGVAKATDSHRALTTMQTDCRQLIGTLQYMSPEQCRGNVLDLDTSSDVYSLGVVLYELLVDHLPYEVCGVPLTAAIDMIQHVEPNGPGTVNHALRGDVDAIVRRALDKSGHRRYRSAAELGDDIRRHLDGEAIVARPPGLLDAVRRFARRHRVAAAAAGGAAALLPVLILALVWVLISVSREASANRRAAESAGLMWESRNQAAPPEWSSAAAEELAQRARREATAGLAALDAGRSGEAAETLIGALATLDRAESEHVRSIEDLEVEVHAAVEAHDLDRADAGLRTLAGLVDTPRLEPLQLEVAVLELTSSLIDIPPGSFEMGSDDAESERPVHTVSFARGFRIAKTEVTRAQYLAVTGRDPAYFREDLRQPVESVSWPDAVEFCNRLSARAGLTPCYRLSNHRYGENGGLIDAAVARVPGDGYRLPSEAEWEHACRAGTDTPYFFGDGEDADVVDRYMWSRQNAEAPTHPVGTREPNPWGLYDTYGNVWEWVEDEWHSGYDGAPSDGSAWTDSPAAAARVTRGGAWAYYPVTCRSTIRQRTVPDGRLNLGFRIAQDR